MARGHPVYLLRRPDGSYLVRTAGRVSTQTHELAWAASLLDPEAAAATAARLACWDRVRLDLLAAGDRRISCEATGCDGWLAMEVALIRRLRRRLEQCAGRRIAEPGPELLSLLVRLLAALEARDVRRLRSIERELADGPGGPGWVDPTWADRQFATGLPFHRGAYLLSAGGGALRLLAVRDGDERAAALAAGLEQTASGLWEPIVAVALLPE